MDSHYCSACGEPHGGESRTAPEVEIARINAKRDIEVARLARGIERDDNATELAVAEIEAETGVEAAEAVADAVTEILVPEPAPEPASEPVVIQDVVEDDPEATIEPAEPSGPPAEPRKRSGGSGWFG